MLALGFIGGCASYQPLPLDPSLPLKKSWQSLRMDASQHHELPLKWRSQRVQIEDGLNEVEVIQLSILNSPQLRATQAKLKESQAQLLQAGLLPDPQLNVSADIPQSSQKTLLTAYNIGLGFDIQSLITQHAKINVATKLARSQYLQVLWQEWQIIQQARMLYRRALIQQQQVALAYAQFVHTQHNWTLQENALQHHNATLDTEGLARIAMMNAQFSWFEMQRQQHITAHRLALLLGLSPDIALPLVPPKQGLSSLMTLSVYPQDVSKLWSLMRHQRPDLLALEAAYQAQESKVRQQILSQFPNLSLGINTLKDNVGIWTIGPFINMNLPILNRNQGNIAIARATRTRLREEYHARVASAVIKVSQLLSDQRLAWKEWSALHRKLPDLEQLMQQMGKALASGNMDMLTYTTLQRSEFAQKVKILTLEQAILEQAVALDTLLGFIQEGERPGYQQQGGQP